MRLNKNWASVIASIFLVFTVIFAGSAIVFSGSARADETAGVGGSNITVSNAQPDAVESLKQQIKANQTGMSWQVVGALNAAIYDAQNGQTSLTQSQANLIAAWAAIPDTAQYSEFNSKIRTGVNRGSISQIANNVSQSTAITSLIGESAWSRLRDLRDVDSNDFALGSNTLYGQFGLSEPPTYSDLYASVLFSEANGKSSLDQVDISLSQLSKYPATSDENTVYGKLAKPGHDDPVTPAGAQLGSYIKTLYTYDWLVVKPKDGVSGFASATLQLFEDNMPATAVMSHIAVLGAKLFDIAHAVIGYFQNITSNFSVVALFGLGGDTSSFLANVLSDMLSGIGFTPGLVKIIVSYAKYILAFLFALTLIIALMKANVKKHITKLRMYATRFLIIIIAIPMSLLTMDLVKDAQGLMINTGLPYKLNSAFIVDTQRWASTMNLSLAPVNPAGQLSTTAVEASSDFAPTSENVQKLSNLISSKSAAAGLEVNQSSAADLLEKFNSHETVTISGYSADVAKAALSGTATIAASNDVNGGSPIIGAKGENLEKNPRAESTTPYPIFIQPAAKDVSATTPTNGSYVLQAGDGQTCEISTSDASLMSYTPVTWSNLQTYIYGFVPSGNQSSSEKVFANYIYDLGKSEAVQNFNPDTGQVGTNSDNGNCQNVLNTNALTIALMNRYNGISMLSGSSLRSLSTQSVAFLLQSTFNDDQLSFSGYRTAPNDEGAAKNTGVGGNQFVRYTMPNTGSADLTGRLAGLAGMWGGSAIVYIFALFALFRAPVLGAIAKQIIGFLRALFTGSIAGLVSHIFYYVALNMSFVLAGFAALLGANIIGSIMSNPALAGFISGVSTPNNPLGFVTAAIGGLLVLIISSLIAVGLCWPAFSISLGGTNNKRKVAAVEVIVLIPYLIADIMSERVDQLERRLYGSRGLGIGNTLKQRMGALSPKEALAAGHERMTGGSGKIGSIVRAGQMGALAAGQAMSGNFAGAVSSASKAAGGLGNAFGDVAGSNEQESPAGGVPDSRGQSIESIDSSESGIDDTLPTATNDVTASEVGGSSTPDSQLSDTDRAAREQLRAEDGKKLAGMQDDLKKKKKAAGQTGLFQALRENDIERKKASLSKKVQIPAIAMDTVLQKHLDETEKTSYQDMRQQLLRENDTAKANGLPTRTDADIDKIAKTFAAIQREKVSLDIPENVQRDMKATAVESLSAASGKKGSDEAALRKITETVEKAYEHQYRSEMSRRDKLAEFLSTKVGQNKPASAISAMMSEATGSKDRVQALREMEKNLNAQSEHMRTHGGLNSGS